MHSNGYNIKGIKGLSSEDWREMGLKKGQLSTLKGTLDKFRLKRAQREGSSDVSE